MKAPVGLVEGTAGYLLDTSVLSALSPGRAALLADDFRQWLRAADAEERLFIPCIAIAEIEQGIAKLHRAGGIDRAARLRVWLDGLLHQFNDRLLPLDAPAARAAGRLADEAIARGVHPGFADVAIAAIAQHSGLLILTRNLRHFEPLGVSCADPMLAPP